MYIENALYPLGEQNKIYLEYVAKNGVFSVRRMNDGFGVDPEQVHMLYVQSFYLVKLLVDTYGPEKYSALQQLIHDGMDAEIAIQKIYQLSLEQLEQKLAESLGTITKNEQSTPTVQLKPTYIPTIVPIGSNTQPIVTSREPSISWGTIIGVLLCAILVLVFTRWKPARKTAKVQVSYKTIITDQSEES